MTDTWTNCVYTIPDEETLAGIYAGACNLAVIGLECFVAGPFLFVAGPHGAVQAWHELMQEMVRQDGYELDDIDDDRAVGWMPSGDVD